MSFVFPLSELSALMFRIATRVVLSQTRVALSALFCRIAIRDTGGFDTRNSATVQLRLCRLCSRRDLASSILAFLTDPALTPALVHRDTIGLITRGHQWDPPRWFVHTEAEWLALVERLKLTPWPASRKPNSTACGGNCSSSATRSSRRTSRSSASKRWRARRWRCWGAPAAIPPVQGVEGRDGEG